MAEEVTAPEGEETKVDFMAKLVELRGKAMDFVKEPANRNVVGAGFLAILFGMYQVAKSRAEKAQAEAERLAVIQGRIVADTLRSDNVADFLKQDERARRSSRWGL